MRKEFNDTSLKNRKKESSGYLIYWLELCIFQNDIISFKYDDDEKNLLFSYFQNMSGTKNTSSMERQQRTRYERGKKREI